MKNDIKKDFEIAFSNYWYHKKPIARRLTDSKDNECEVAALFFESLNDLGMLDKLYPKDKKVCYVREGK